MCIKCRCEEILILLQLDVYKHTDQNFIFSKCYLTLFKYCSPDK